MKPHTTLFTDLGDDTSRLYILRNFGAVRGEVASELEEAGREGWEDRISIPGEVQASIRVMMTDPARLYGQSKRRYIVISSAPERGY